LRVSDRGGLRADCARCFALCCVALPFAASADFAIDKDAGRPCPHLGGDHRCGIHGELRERGFPGCVAYDCFGAGQRVSQITFGGVGWRESPQTARRMFAAFPVVRHLHEAAWYLTEALELESVRPLHGEAAALLERTDRLAGGGPEELADLDLAAHRREVGALLRRVSALARADASDPTRDLAERDLAGADLSGADFHRADLRGARLIATDLRGADLRLADLLGADLRGARLQGADLTGALFVTSAQVGAANGDAATRLPAALAAPSHWRGRPV
jgi:hypothetical protein